MTYVSTRGGAPAASFRDALLAGLAPDGGLFMPGEWPRLDEAVLDSAASFSETASQVLAPFAAPWLDRAELQTLAGKAYASFARPDVAPLVPIGGDDYLLELFHGPTLAFKDVAMQLLGLMFERALGETGSSVTIVGATSGDTGGAAVEAFRGRAGVELYILHPEGRISEVQRRFMTTASEPNIHNIAVDGAFDDCQAIVKEIFADRDFSERHRVSAINSINWARLAIQMVYYVTAAAALPRKGESRLPNFCVPTGNFGDVFAGYATKKCGLQFNKLCVAVNANDIMHRVLTTGEYAPRRAISTSSPSMDIQVASNFERLLFEASGRDRNGVKRLMDEFARNGRCRLPDRWLLEIRRDFVSASVNERECAETIAMLHADHGILIDPHTAVGIAAARIARAKGELVGPVVTLATAHPAKFPDAVEAAAGVRPTLPGHVGDLFARPERYERAPADVNHIKRIIAEQRVS